MSDRMLSEYFSRELKAAGYEPRNDGIYWSLGYCQGDGMAFEAYCDLSALADRLLAGATKAAAKRAVEKANISAKVTHSGNYYHSRSMSVGADDCWAEETCTALEQKAWAELLALLDSDVESISERLEKDGYSLQENCNPAWFVKGKPNGDDHVIWRTFETENFRVVQKLIQDDDYNGYTFGNEHDHDDVKRIVRGEVVVCGVVAEVQSKATGSIVGGASLWGIADTPDLEYTLGELREITREAIETARKNVGHLRLRRVA